mmetsp:Transcript_35562/g.111653  ORF Transcript_35562/g.111653 Transcript_35562/m.111653 type:complete len:315 (+) Transcript_35562:156-1100(+)
MEAATAAGLMRSGARRRCVRRRDRRERGCRIRLGHWSRRLWRSARARLLRGRLRRRRPARRDGDGELAENRLGGTPVHASARDAHAACQLAAGRERLPALQQVRRQHCAADAPVPARNARGDRRRRRRLLLRRRAAGAVPAVDHGARRQAERRERAARRLLRRGGRGGRQDEVAVAVAGRLHDAGDALLGDGEEGVARGGGSDRVDGRVRRMRLALESDWRGEARGELAVESACGGRRGDCTPRDKVCDELRRDGVEIEAARRQPKPCDVDEQLPRLAEAAVDLKGAVEPGVIHRARPAASPAGGLVEEDAHDE